MMDRTYWLKQTTETPLYESLLWSRPENKQFAGKLLVIGGNAHGFQAPAEAYKTALQSGVGTCKVIMPDAVKKVVGHVLPDADFAPSTPSGSFNQKALNELLIAANWADGVILAGDLGRSSETSVLLESFMQKYTGQLTITKDAIEYVHHVPSIIERPNTTLVLSLSQLQKLAIALHFDTPFLLSMGLLLLCDALHKFTELHAIHIVTKELDQLVVASNGTVSSTKLATDVEIWRVKQAAKCSVLWLQNPNNTFEALTSAVVL
jgi:ADP-dependent NAD(P)H-hydrate dehydratase / NAD(P)H-hydrate epimerase